MARQAERLQTRVMLSSVTFDSGTSQLDISLDGSDSVSAQVVVGQVEVSINGTPTGDSPNAWDVYFISVTGGSDDGTGLDGECGLDTLDGVTDASDECGDGSGRAIAR